MTNKILFEDKHIICVEKEAGQLSVKGVGSDTSLQDSVSAYCKCDVGVVHRLDRPVGGVLLFAKTKSCLIKLNEDFRNKNIKKVYKAIVHGQTPNSEKLEDWLLKNQRTNMSKVVQKNCNRSKLAILTYNKIVYNKEKNLTKIEVLLETGRHHQIRVQLANKGYGILGDKKYFKSKGENLCLWGTSMTFTHPVTQEVITLESDPKNFII